MILGVPIGTVELQPHDDEWNITAAQKIEQLKKDLQKYDITIKHVGSTAVPVLLANPIIDIAIGVEEPEDIKRICSWFARHGYKRFKTMIRHTTGFCIESDGIRYYQFFIMDRFSNAWSRMLAFRDFMNKNHVVARMYNRNRVRNWDLPYDEYTRSKDPLVEAVMKRCRNNY